MLAAAEGLFESCIAAIPYAPATAFLANERAKLDGRSGDDGETPRDRDPRRRHRLDARRHPHDRGDPPARRPRLRDRGGRHRPRGRPAPIRRRGDRRALLPGPFDRRPESARRRADALRRRLRRDPRLLARDPRASPARSSPARSACHYSAAITPSSPPTPACARAIPAWPPRWRWRSAPFTMPATSSSPPASPPTRLWPGSEWLPSGSSAGIAALTPRASTPPCVISRCCLGERSTCSTPGASPARRAPTCLPTRSCSRASATLACTSSSPAAAPSRSACGAPRRAATFLGWLSGAELARTYASADLFLFPPPPTPSVRSSSRPRLRGCR